MVVRVSSSHRSAARRVRLLIVALLCCALIGNIFSYGEGVTRMAFASSAAADDAASTAAPAAAGGEEQGCHSIPASPTQAVPPAHCAEDLSDAPHEPHDESGALRVPTEEALELLRHKNEKYERNRARVEAEQVGSSATPAATVAPATAPASFLNLTGLTDEELKIMLSDKKKGQVNLKRYKSRDDLIKAIREVEKKEQAQQALRAEVEAAGRWYVEMQEELKYRRAAARRARSSRIKHEGEVPEALRRDSNTDAPKHELRIVYNQAKGYERHYDAVVKDLKTLEAVRLPNLDDVRILGEPAPISSQSAILGQVFSVAFYGVMALAIVPDLVPFIPEAGRNILRTRRGLVISTAFMLNMLGRSVLQDNTFEVYLDDELIYSTLKLNGRLPTSEMVSNLVLERTLLKDYAAAMAAKAGQAAASALF